MAKTILKNCVIVVDGVDFSNHVSSVEINASKDDIDTTSFDGSGRERKGGLQDNSFVVNFQQDFDAASVDATLFPLWNTEPTDEFTVAIKPTTAAISTTNPEYSGTCILLEYSPLNGSVGELSETSVTFPVQRGTFTRDTTP
jgi:hypothetical protein